MVRCRLHRQRDGIILAEAGPFAKRLSRNPTKLSRAAEITMKSEVAAETQASPTTCDWNELAQRVLTGHQLTEAEGLAILQSSDDQLLDIMAAAYRIRRQFFGNTVQLYFLMNAKSGLCPEDCSYCSQSRDSQAEIPKYNILSRDKLLDGARIAAERNSKTYWGY